MNARIINNIDGTMTMQITSSRKAPIDVYEMPILTRADRKRKLEEYILLLTKEKAKYEQASAYYLKKATAKRSNFGDPGTNWADLSAQNEEDWDSVSEAEEGLESTLKVLKVAERLLVNWL